MCLEVIILKTQIINCQNKLTVLMFTLTDCRFSKKNQPNDKQYLEDLGKRVYIVSVIHKFVRNILLWTELDGDLV